ncbi:MAG: glycogen synthase [Ignavibacteriae bacterium]|nr:glycogen synthase [Ignavibacteriota bacterium]
MAKPLSVLFVSSEALPYVKYGGVADVAYSLPLALRDLGHDMRIMLPKYGSVSERRNRIHEINRLRDVPIPIGNHSEPATIKSSSINNPRAKVQAYITTNNKYFDAKKGIYSDAKTGKPYPDNHERFIYFCRSVIETCLILSWFPDIIHCNDWQTAFVMIMAKTAFAKDFKKTKFVYTFHNIHQQGEFSEKQFDLTGLNQKVKNDLLHKKMINPVKGALMYSDYITTVSDTYAKEILQDSKHTNELNALLLKYKKRYKGILNGIDTYSWDPKTDLLISKKFSNNFEDFKQANKKSLSVKMGLTYSEETPLIGMVTRLDEQKGVTLVTSAADKLFHEDIQMVILCDGTQESRNDLRDLSLKYPKKLKVKFGYDEIMAHQIEAGSDMFLMPSEYEPCGLNAMYSLVYGSVPIVRNTGGLTEIVNDFDADKKSGNGFTFKNYKNSDMLASITKAISLFKNKDLWEQIVQNGMSGDYSWSKSVKEYDEIYKSITKD